MEVAKERTRVAIPVRVNEQATVAPLSSQREPLEEELYKSPEE